MMQRWRLLALAGASWIAAAGCGSSNNPAGGLVDTEGGVPMDDGGAIGPATSCASSKDCPVNQVCDPNSKTCVECFMDNDCSMGLKCIGSHCSKPAAACMNSLDCKSDMANPICDTSTGKCVVCVTSKDCPTSNDCINHACKPYTSCTNSLDCPQGQVCETTRMRCVECIGNNDCPTSSKCVGNACRSSCTSDTMCTAQGLLCDLNQGICVQCVSANDCRPDEYCATGGTCTADVCTANSTSCMNNSVVTCRADGSGFGSPVSCGGQVCVPSGMTAACKDHLCTPSVTGCSSTAEQVVKCAADGLSQTVVDDCAGKMQVCVAAQCVTGVCSPGKRYCANNEARQCSLKGDMYTVLQTCAVTDYCDAVTGSCKPLVCAPNMPACNGRVLTTCNADGSGYQVGGTDCSPKYCYGGKCVDYLFREDFESGALLGWTNGTGTYTRMVTNALAAAGTMYSLYLTKTGGLTGYNDGIYQTFAVPLAPSSLSWYIRAPSIPFYYSGNVALFSGNGPTPTDQLLRVYFHYVGSIYVAGSTTATKLYTTNTWYHIEIKNINWIARTFDAYIDGVLLSMGMHFSGTGTSIGRVDLFSYYSTSDPAYYDQIEFLP